MAESSFHATEFNKIGTILTGTNAQSLDVAPSTYTTICSISIPRGTWIVIAGNQYSTNFSAQCIGAIVDANSAAVVPSTVRYSGSNGGGYNAAVIVTHASDTPTTLSLRTYHSDSETRTASAVSMKAIRIA